MARSCTPPPLSDRKRIVAEAHRRRSLALPQPSFEQVTSSEDGRELDHVETMEVDEFSLAERTRGREMRRKSEGRSSRIAEGIPEIESSTRTSTTSLRVKPRPSSANVTPERPRDPVLPTWTPLQAPNESEPSEPSESLTSTSVNDRARPAASRPRPVPTSTPYNPSKQFRFPKDAMRWLPASVVGGSEAASSPSKPTASSLKAVQPTAPNGATSFREQVEGVSTPPSASRPGFRPRAIVKKSIHRSPPPSSRGKLHSTTDKAWAADFVQAINRSFDPHAKGKERAQPPPETELSDSEGEAEAEPAREDLLSSPAIPHPPLPEDSFEDSIWVDEDDQPAVHALPSRKSRKRIPLSGSSSRWLHRLADQDVFKGRTVYYVGKKPQRRREKEVHAQSVSPNNAIPAKRKRTYSSTSLTYASNAHEQAEAFNIAMAINTRDLSSAPSVAPSNTRRTDRTTAQGHAEVFAAASANNVNIDRAAVTSRLPAKAKVGRPPKARRQTLAHTNAPTSVSSSKRPRMEPLSEREASEDAVEEILDSRAPDSEGSGDWYLDFETVSWRRRTSSGESAPTSAPPAPNASTSSVPPANAGASRSDAGPSSAVAVNLLPKTDRGRGRPRLPDELRKSPRREAGKHVPTGRPRGRPRKYPLPEAMPAAVASVAGGSTVPTLPMKRPRGRPRKRPLPGGAPVAATPAVGGSTTLAPPSKRPRGRPRKHPLPESAPAATAAEGSTMLVTPTARPRGRPREHPLPGGAPPAVFVFAPGSSVFSPQTAHHLAPATRNPLQTAPPGFWTEIDITGPILSNPSHGASSTPASSTSQAVPRNAFAGATSESEDSTLVQRHSYSSPNDLQPSAQVEEPEEADEKMAMAIDEKIVADVDDDVLEYLDLSTWGQMKDDAARRQASASTSTAPQQPSPVAPSPPPTRQPDVPPIPTQLFPNPRPSHMPELISLADIQQPPPPEYYRSHPYSQAQPGPSSMPQTDVPDEHEQVPEYQSFDALLASLLLSARSNAGAAASSADATTRGLRFAGSYSIVVDDRTKLTEPFVRKIGTQFRHAMRSAGSWVFRVAPDSQTTPSIDSGVIVTNAYGCMCKNRPLVPSAQNPKKLVKAKMCGGIVSVSAQEVKGGKVYAGVKGFRITVRVRH